MMANKRKSPPGPTDPPPAKAKRGTAGSKENAIPIRRSGRSTKGQGGELQQKQTVSEAVQPHQGLPRQKKTHTQDIPDNVVKNPMAPMPAKRSKRSKANVFPTLPQGMPMPTVPRPLSYMASSHTELNMNNRDSMFGFHLPPQISPLVAGSSNPSSGSSVTTGASPLASVAKADGSRVPIDPVLLAESQSQPSLRQAPVVYHSSSQVHQRQGPTSLLPGQNPSTGDRSKGQVTGIDIRTRDTFDSNGEDDSEDDGEDDKVDEFGVEYESDIGDSDDGSELVLLGHSEVHNTDNGGETNNDGYQDIGAEYSTHHDLHDPLLVPGFDQSPSEDERFFQAQLRFPSEPEVTFEGSGKKRPKRASHHKRQRTSQKNSAQNAETGAKGNDPYDVVGKYYQRNRAPIPPHPVQLEKIRSQNSRDASVETGVGDKQCSEASTDEGEKTRARRYSQKCYTRSANVPKRLGFYPPQWRDVLEKAQKLWRSWMALECGFPERETKEHLDKAMQCVIKALSEHQENGRKVENGFWEEHQDDMREYIFADKSTFRGIIKTKAAEIVHHRYDFRPKETPNNQQEEIDFISNAIQNLLDEGKFLRGGYDELGKTNNLTHPAIKELSIHIYKLAVPSLSAEFEKGIPCKIVALAASAIRCCLDAWRLGWETKKDFTAGEYGRTYNSILELIERMRQHPYHWEKFTAARRTWAEEVKFQTCPNAELGATDMDICLD